jgi:hypothetical protein
MKQYTLSYRIGFRKTITPKWWKFKKPYEKIVWERRIHVFESELEDEKLVTFPRTLIEDHPDGIFYVELEEATNLIKL